MRCPGISTAGVSSLGVRLRRSVEKLGPWPKVALPMTGRPVSLLCDAYGAPTAAPRAGFRATQLILAINGLELSDSRAYLRNIIQIPVGQPATLSVLRTGKAQDITATVGEWPTL